MTPDEIGAAIASEWGEGVERMDQADIAKIAVEGARRAQKEARESPEVKLETTAEERAKWAHLPRGEVESSLVASSLERLLRDVATILAEVARLKAELAEAKTDAARDAAGIRSLIRDATAREATARAEGQEDVLRFIRNGHFLHDDAPTKQFAKAVESNWNSHGKAAADRVRSAP